MDSSEEIIKNYKNKVPVLLDDSLNLFEKTKFIVPRNITIRQFHCILTNKCSINSKQTLLLFINNTLPMNDDLIGSLYNLHKDLYGYLNIKVSRENSFG